MAKPYLSLIVPVNEGNLLEAMLGLMNADRMLQSAMFDYEFLVVVSDVGEATKSMDKFVSAIANAMPSKTPSHAKTIFFHVTLYGITDITQVVTGFHGFNSPLQCLASYADKFGRLA